MYIADNFDNQKSIINTAIKNNHELYGTCQIEKS